MISFGRKSKSRTNHAPLTPDPLEPIPYPGVARVEPAIAAPTQEIDTLEQDDLLGEADVYWTYGRWHEAMPIYGWWISAYGPGLENRVARRYLDCAAKAMDFTAMVSMLRQLIAQQVDSEFLREISVAGLMHDPSNFELMKIAEEVGVEASRIVQIAQRVVEKEITPAQRKQELWRRNRLDAQNLSSADPLGAQWENGPGQELVQGRANTPVFQKPDALLAPERIARLFGCLCGEPYLDDSAILVDTWKIEQVLAQKRRRMHARPLQLAVAVDVLRLAHGESHRDDYAMDLLSFCSILLSANAGSGLRRRLLSAGRLLGQHPIFDFLSSSPGKDFLPVAEQVQQSATCYVPETAWKRSQEWMQPLVYQKSPDHPAGEQG